MITVEDYKSRYPNELISRISDPKYVFDPTKPHYSIRYILEGMIEFTEESSSYLAGPFDGNYGQFLLKDYREAIMPHGPDKGMKLLDYYAKYDKQVIDKYNRSSDPQKKKPYLIANDGPTWAKPFAFYICGNDDSSYTAFYATEQEMMDEFNLFVANQPLDMVELRHKFGFVFTN